MSILKFKNNATTTLASPISAGATTAILASGTGSRFPALSPGEYFVATLVDAATGLVNEIVHVTARSADTVTLVRAQEGTTALNWAAGDSFLNLWTAGSADQYLQQGEQQSQSANYATDTGTANAYVCALTPALTVHTVGMPIRVFIAAGHTSTGTSTLDPGPGAVNIIHAGTLHTIQAGDIAENSIYTFVYDGINYQMLSPSQMVGDTGTGGKQGVVPAPGAGDAAAGKFLGAAGAWALVDLALASIGDETLSTNGHVVLGPLIVNWGRAVNVPANGGTSGVTWNKAFPTACLAAICSQNTNTTGSIERSGVCIYGMSTTGATIGNNWTSNSDIGYISIGY